REGIDIDGLDDSADMLAICRDKADAGLLEVKLIHQQMERMQLPRRYRTILVPSSSLQLLTESQATSDALSAIYNHLEPGGVVLASFMTLWKQGKPAEEAWEESASTPDGVLYRRVAITRVDPIERLEHTEDRYEKLIDGQVVRSEVHKRSPATRSYNQDQAVQLFEKAGFAAVETLKAFADTPAGRPDTLFVIRAVRPGAETQRPEPTTIAEAAPIPDSARHAEADEPSRGPTDTVVSTSSTEGPSGPSADFRLGDNDI
ncbi:MAG: class I SAM-dependent methyltransferase, partial [Armatimonadaceae bacterium]